MAGSFHLKTGANDTVTAPADNLALTNALAVALGLHDGTALDVMRAVASDAQAATGLAAIVGMLFNGATYDRPRTPKIFKLIDAVAITAAAGIHTMGVADFGNGILSSTADMNLNLDVSATSTVSGTVWGTEE